MVLYMERCLYHISNCSRYENTSSDQPHVQVHQHINLLASSVSIVQDLPAAFHSLDQYNADNTSQIQLNQALQKFHGYREHHSCHISSIPQHFLMALFHYDPYNLQAQEESMVIHHQAIHNLSHHLNVRQELVHPSNADVQKSIHGNDS